MPEEPINGVRIVNYHSKANEIVRSRIILQYHLFSLLVEGQKSVHTPHSHIQIADDHFLLLTSGHYLMTEKTISPQGNYQSILLFFTQEALSSFFHKYPDLLLTTSTQQANGCVQAFAKDDFLKGFIQSLSLMTADGYKIPAALQALKLEELLLYLAHKHPAQLAGLRALAKHSCETDQALKNLVESHIESNITMEELAFLSNISFSTFKRRFLKLYGMPPSKWFLQKKMEHAAALLRLGKEKPGEICYKIGYENHSSFSYSFKQMYGVTPKEYSNRHM
ncbi:AraC family transcriptional regulator [Filimonas zeae]|uniref:AraC family transcriptional regulator n=2 Tax=Filimonas zeae TaxID=1737353 RepID=A0A917J2S6_9BACT|nr:AraC family transcriptional regulator [Filimonas zeae]